MPLKPGKSKQVQEENFHELRHGKQFAKTKQKFEEPDEKGFLQSAADALLLRKNTFHPTEAGKKLAEMDRKIERVTREIERFQPSGQVQRDPRMPLAKAAQPRREPTGTEGRQDGQRIAAG